MLDKQTAEMILGNRLKKLMKTEEFKSADIIKQARMANACVIEFDNEFSARQTLPVATKEVDEGRQAIESA